MTAPTSVEETAAIMAALERFAAETAPAPSGGEATGLDPWTRVALLEGVTRVSHADVPHPWINT